MDTGYSHELKEISEEKKAIRRKVPTIDSRTVLQKVLSPYQVEEYLSKGKTNVTGDVFRASDIAPFANNLESAVKNIRLDYYVDNKSIPGAYDGNDYLET